MKPLTPPDILTRTGGTPIVCLAACTTPVASLLDPQCDAVPASVTEPLVRRITAEVAVPAIGIGASAAVAAHAEDVRARRFPGQEHMFADSAP
ncbi:MAG: hypothetical protein ACK4PG_16395 [Acetobacteraceae bacterium]